MKTLIIETSLKDLKAQEFCSGAEQFGSSFFLLPGSMHCCLSDAPPHINTAGSPTATVSARLRCKPDGIQRNTGNSTDITDNSTFNCSVKAAVIYNTEKVV